MFAAADLLSYNHLITSKEFWLVCVKNLEQMWRKCENVDVKSLSLFNFQVNKFPFCVFNTNVLWFYQCVCFYPVIAVNK